MYTVFTKSQKQVSHPGVCSSMLVAFYCMTNDLIESKSICPIFAYWHIMHFMYYTEK